MPKPPPQAFDACRQKKVNDACKVTFMDMELEGTCVAFEGALACLPKNFPRPP